MLLFTSVCPKCRHARSICDDLCNTSGSPRRSIQIFQICIWGHAAKLVCTRDHQINSGRLLGQVFAISSSVFRMVGLVRWRLVLRLQFSSAGLCSTGIEEYLLKEGSCPTGTKEYRITRSTSRRKQNNKVLLNCCSSLQSAAVPCKDAAIRCIE